MPPVPWLRASAPCLAVSAVVVLASLTTRAAAYLAQVRDPGSPPLAVLRLFDVNSERNVPTAWSVALLLGAAAMCLHLASSTGRHVGGQRRGWRVLAGVLLLLAADEGLALHERLGNLGRDLAGGALHFAWVVPGLLVGAVLAVTALASLHDHDGRLRQRLVVAGLVYVTGAVGLETLSGSVLRAAGDRELYVAVTAAEEGLELAGLSLLLGALVLARRAGRGAPPSPHEGTLTAV